jgi:hypothetical protein
MNPEHVARPILQGSHHRNASQGRRQGWALLAIFTSLFLLNLFLLSRENVFRHEFSAESDEPAHFTSALMIRDYILKGFPQNPFEYARQYYLHYPKVALGHWPPAFYLIQAAWMLLFGVSRESVFCLMAALAAGVSTSLCWLVTRTLQSWPLGATAGALFMLLPLVRSYTGSLMTDLLVAAFTWWSLMAWVRFFESNQARYAYLGAFLIAAGILSKGNGYAAFVIPFTALLAGGRWQLLRQRTFWLSIGLIFVTTTPWSFFTNNLVAPTFQYQPGPAFFLQASAYYSWHLVLAAGALTSLLALIGLAVKIAVPLPRLQVEPAYGCALGALLGVQIFHSLVPAGLEPRYLIASLPPLLLFAAAGAQWIGLRAAAAFSLRPALVYSGLAAAWFTVFAFTGFRLVPKPGYAFRQLAHDLAQHPEFDRSAILCTSEYNGEGMMVTEMALLDSQRPSRLVVRSSRLLAESDWNGLNYKWRVEPSAAAVQNLLKRIPVNVVVVDHVPGRNFPHHRVLLQVVENTAHWKLMRSYPSGPAQVDVYVSTEPSPVDPRSHLHVDLTPSPRISLRN